MNRNHVRNIRLEWVRRKQRYNQFLEDCGGMPEDDTDYINMNDFDTY